MEQVATIVFMFSKGFDFDEGSPEGGAERT